MNENEHEVDWGYGDIGGHKSLIQYHIDKTPKEYRKEGGMTFGNIHLKPILLYLPDEKGWVERYRLAQEHLKQEGFENVYELAGVHAKRWGVLGRHSYLLDGRPQEQFYNGEGNTGNYISQYAAYLVMDALDYSHYMYMEGDCRFVPGWREKLEKAIIDAGDDWDILFVGSCCCAGKGAVNIGGDVYEFPFRGAQNWGAYPMCTHCYIVNKRCVKHLIATNRDVANSTDISLMYNSFPKMRVLAIIPRLADQYGTNLTP